MLCLLIPVSLVSSRKKKVNLLIYNFYKCFILLHVRIYASTPINLFHLRRMKRNDDGDFFSSSENLKTHSLKCMMFSKTRRNPSISIMNSRRVWIAKNSLAFCCRWRYLLWSTEEKQRNANSFVSEQKVPFWPFQKKILGHMSCWAAIFWLSDGARNGRSFDSG